MTTLMRLMLAGVLTLGLAACDDDGEEDTGEDEAGEETGAIQGSDDAVQLAFAAERQWQVLEPRLGEEAADAA